MTTLASVGNGTIVSAGGLRIAADGNADNFASTIAGAGGVVALAGAAPSTSTVARTHASLGSIDDSGTPVNGGASTVLVNLTNRGTGTFSIGAGHTAKINTEVLTIQIGLLSGSGADLDNVVNSTTTAQVGPGAVVRARSVDVAASNSVLKPQIQNVFGTTAGLVSGAGAYAYTPLTVQSIVRIHDGADIEVVGAESNAELITLRANNYYDLHERIAFFTFGALSGAFATGELRTILSLAKVDIGAARISSPGALDLSARTSGTARVNVSAETFGAATVTVGDATAYMTPRNIVEIGTGATLIALGDISLLAGRSKASNPLVAADLWSLEARWDGVAGSLIPLSSVDATPQLQIVNQVLIRAGALVETAREANLHANRDTFATMQGQAKVTSWLSAIGDALSSLFGGGETIERDSLAQAQGTVLNDGVVRTGTKRQKLVRVHYYNDNPALGLIAVTVERRRHRSSPTSWSRWGRPSRSTACASRSARSPRSPPCWSPSSRPASSSRCTAARTRRCATSTPSASPSCRPSSPRPAAPRTAPTSWPSPLSRSTRSPASSTSAPTRSSAAASSRLRATSSSMSRTTRSPSSTSAASSSPAASAASTSTAPASRRTRSSTR